MTFDDYNKDNKNSNNEKYNKSQYGRSYIYSLFEHDDDIRRKQINLYFFSNKEISKIETFWEILEKHVIENWYYYEICKLIFSSNKRYDKNIETRYDFDERINLFQEFYSLKLLIKLSQRFNVDFYVPNNKNGKEKWEAILSNKNDEYELFFNNSSLLDILLINKDKIKKIDDILDIIFYISNNEFSLIQYMNLVYKEVNNLNQEKILKLEIDKYIQKTLIFIEKRKEYIKKVSMFIDSLDYEDDDYILYLKFLNNIDNDDKFISLLKSLIEYKDLNNNDSRTLIKLKKRIDKIKENQIYLFDQLIYRSIYDFYLDEINKLHLSEEKDKKEDKEVNYKELQKDLSEQLKKELNQRIQTIKELKKAKISWFSLLEECEFKIERFLECIESEKYFDSSINEEIEKNLRNKLKEIFNNKSEKNKNINFFIQYELFKIINIDKHQNKDKEENQLVNLFENKLKKYFDKYYNNQEIKNVEDFVNNFICSFYQKNQDFKNELETYKLFNNEELKILTNFLVDKINNDNEVEKNFIKEDNKEISKWRNVIIESVDKNLVDYEHHKNLMREKFNEYILNQLKKIEKNISDLFLKPTENILKKQLINNEILKTTEFIKKEINIPNLNNKLKNSNLKDKSEEEINQIERELLEWLNKNISSILINFDDQTRFANIEIKDYDNIHNKLLAEVTIYNAFGYNGSQQQRIELREMIGFKYSKGKKLIWKDKILRKLGKAEIKGAHWRCLAYASLINDANTIYLAISGFPNYSSYMNWYNSRKEEKIIDDIKEIFESNIEPKQIKLIKECREILKIELKVSEVEMIYLNSNMKVRCKDVLADKDSISNDEQRTLINDYCTNHQNQDFICIKDYFELLSRQNQIEENWLKYFQYNIFSCAERKIYYCLKDKDIWNIKEIKVTKDCCIYCKHLKNGTLIINDN